MSDHLGFKISTAPTEEPVTAAEAKLHASVDGNDWNDFFSEKIEAARIKVENAANRSLVTRTFTGKLDCFPCEGDLCIEPPYPPLATVTSIYYLEASAGASTLLATTVYGVDVHSEPGRIFLKYGQTWPATYAQPNAIEIIWTAGYGAATAVPDNYKTAISQLVAHWYMNRESQDVPDGWWDLVNADRVYAMV